MGVSSARAKASERDTRCHENVVYLRAVDAHSIYCVEKRQMPICHFYELNVFFISKSSLIVLAFGTTLLPIEINYFLCYIFSTKLCSKESGQGADFFIKK